MSKKTHLFGLIISLFIFFAIVISAAADNRVQVADPISEAIPQGLLVDFEPVASGLTAPHWGISAPGACQVGMNRLYVADQPGYLWAIGLNDGAKSVFLDVSARLVPLGVFGEGSFDERGFMGFAFHPDYDQNGLLYTYTSEPVAGPADFSTMPSGTVANHQAVVLEWTVPQPCNPASVVDPASQREILRVDEPQFNHNAGALNFGPDGYLYIALGDGGGADDQDGQEFFGAPIIGHGATGNGQNPENVLGSILRIDPSESNSGNGQYGIPMDNPFVGQAGYAAEIYAYGFRNPYRFSFDKQLGTLYAGDVGQNDIEEVDIVTAGGNYGWNLKEGSFCFDANGNEPGFAYACDLNDGLIDPVAEYDHDDGISVIGGFVYRGSLLKHLRGQYVFGDWSQFFFGNNGRLFYLDKRGELTEFWIPGQDDLGFSLNGFGQDANGELYVLGNTTGTPFGETGFVLKLTRARYSAELSGAAEVPPVTTDASGSARLVPTANGSAVKVFVRVRHLEDAVAAHIHCGAEGSNGPVGLTLFSGGPISIDNGFLVRDVFSEPNPGNACGWQTLADLIDALAAGDTYINVHTLSVPSGEIRGQIE